MFIGKLAKTVLKLLLPQIAELLVPVKKYCFEENEVDIKCKELEQKVTDQGFRLTTLTDMVKTRDEIIDNIQESLKKILNMKEAIPPMIDAVIAPIVNEPITAPVTAVVTAEPTTAAATPVIS